MNNIHDESTKASTVPFDYLFVYHKINTVSFFFFFFSVTYSQVNCEFNNEFRVNSQRPTAGDTRPRCHVHHQINTHVRLTRAYKFSRNNNNTLTIVTKIIRRSKLTSYYSIYI